MTTTIAIDRPYLVESARRLVQIDSVNPSLVEGGAGEAEIAAYITHTLEEIGLEPQQYEPRSGRVSVVGRLLGQGGGRSLMLNAHVDTVGVDGMEEPFSGDVRNGRLYGRGAYDMKGSLAAQLAAAKAIVDADLPLAGDLLVAAVADEEYASIGTANLLDHVRPDGAIVTEPTGLRVCLAHKGFMWLEVETFGRAAHGSRFDRGVDANMRMGRFLVGLEELEQTLRARPPHALVGPPSLHAATLHGGTELSVYAAHCRLGIERRTVPGETAAQVEAEIREILERLAAADVTFQAAMNTVLVRDPFEVSPDAAIVQAVDEAAAVTLGERHPHVGDTPWMDSALLATAGVETVVIGPDGAGAHAAEEWVDVDSLVALSEILARTALIYCRPD